MYLYLPNLKYLQNYNLSLLLCNDVMHSHVQMTSKQEHSSKPVNKSCQQKPANKSTYQNQQTRAFTKTSKQEQSPKPANKSTHPNQ